MVTIWRQHIESETIAIYQSVSQRFFAKSTTEQHIGVGTKALYHSIRYELCVPFHQGLDEHRDREDSAISGERKRGKKTVGGWISVIYQALLEGRLHAALYEYTEEKGGKGTEITERSAGEIGTSNSHTNGQANGHTHGQTHWFAFGS